MQTVTTKKQDSLNYYFLNGFLHPKPYSGYKQSVISLIRNKNSSENKNKIFFVQEKTGFWFLPKSSIDSKHLADGFFSAIAKGLELELGLRGMTVFKIKPQFTQLVYIFDFERQKYNKGRAQQEKDKKNPARGKIYHLASMSYKGEDLFNIKSSKKVNVSDYKWVTEKEARELIESNSALNEGNPGYTESYQTFQKRLFDKIINAQETIEVLRSKKGVVQKKLI